MIRSRWWIPVAAIVVALAIVAIAIGQPRNPALASATGSPTTSAIAGGSTAPSGSASPLESAASLAPVTPAPTLPLPSFGTSETLAQLVALLRVAPEHRDGYQRSLFVHWIDADGDGCDTRREVLIAEAVIAPSVGARCALTGGRWFSLYDGLFFTDSSKLQIDHVVALAEAWDSGAWTWTPDRRKAYANDLDVPWPLIAVSGTTNQSKSDKDPAEWLPPAPAAECPFLSAWI
ncbi:MAG TPA: HNH endonuclease family protein, partial [Candidatus Acidoferrales bacterium]|nr:HNH endonuclease family protein [Candidatus Acidoferrales bacterium]